MQIEKYILLEVLDMDTVEVFPDIVRERSDIEYPDEILR